MMLLLLALVTASACGKADNKKDSAKSPKEIKLVKAEKKTIANYLDEMGEIGPLSITKVKFNFSGKITRLNAEEGDTVRQGQVLAMVYPDINQIKTVTSSQINLKKALANLQSVSNQTSEIASLYKQGLVSRAQYDDLQNQFSIAQDEVKTARLEMESLQKTSSIEKEKAVPVQAPIAGTIITRQVDLGDYIMAASTFQSGTVLFEVADVRDLIIQANINEMDILAISDGAKVEFTFEALPGKTFVGKVFRVFPTPVNDNNVKKYTVQILPTDVLPSNVRLGMSVRIKVLLARKDNVLSIPLGAVIRDADQKKDYVLVAESKDMYKKQMVETGISDFDNIEILSGLQEGQKVVNSPYQVKEDQIIQDKPKAEEDKKGKQEKKNTKPKMPK